MPLLTVFTPSYNRKKTLRRCYESLVRQKNKDFVWMIIDDGSIDGTCDMVSVWKKEGLVSIDYVYQENHGKPFATNVSIDRCSTKYWTCLDSDDCYADNAIEIIISEMLIAEKNEKCCGIVGNKYDLNTRMPVGVDGTSHLAKFMPSNVDFLSNTDLEYKYRIRADKVYVFISAILKQYHYPIIEDEKFIGESLLFERLGLKFVYYISRKPIYLCEYLRDGLTSNCWMLHINNPKGYKLLKQEAMVNPKPLMYKIKNAISYVVGCILCGDKHIIRNSPLPFLTVITFFPGKLLYLYRYKNLDMKE